MKIIELLKELTIALSSFFILKTSKLEQICANQVAWNELYEVYEVLNQERQANTPPPPPLILDDWHFSSDKKKMQEWKKLENWAKENGMYEEIEKLEDSDYYYA